MNANRAKTILLIDDDPQFRQLVMRPLQARSHKVIEAGTAKEAEAILSEARPDLIIVDGQLPDDDGLELLKRLRESDRSTPVVFVSAFWRDRESYRCLTEDLDVALLLHKPVIPAVFGEQIESLLARRADRGSDELDMTPEEAVSALRRAYKEQLPLKLKELEQAIRLARDKPDDQFLLGEVRGRAHKLRGTAGSYGFSAIGEAMGCIEDAITAIITEKSNDRQKAWGEIQSAISQALESIHQHEGASVQQAEHGSPEQIAPALTAAVARLLVVDDDEDFLELVAQLARQRLVEVVPCRSAAEALRKARSVALDGALIDLQLGPTEKSFDLVRRLRELPDCERLPLAFMSANVAVVDRVAAAHSGASLFLDKPLEPDVLESAVQKLVAIGQSQRPRILVVDDDEDFSRQASAILGGQGMVVHSLNETVKVLDVLAQVNPDLLLLDVMMPGLSGFDLCRMLRTTPRWQELPIIFVTAHTGIDARIAAYECGGDDYLPKPVVAEELIARVEVRVERARLLKDRYEKDALTGLLSRRSFMEQLHAMLADGKRHGRPVTVGIIDMDKFKLVNDSFGHLTGDTVLSSFGKLLLRRFRTEDLRGRWGGEEFILAFRDATGDTISGAVERVLSEFQALAFLSEDGRPFNVGFSCGLAFFPADGDSIYALTRVADRRLYRAKMGGRGQVVMAG